MKQEDKDLLLKDLCARWLHEVKGKITYDASKLIDWLNAHHFDYRGLNEKSLALEAPEGMYKKGE